MGLSPRASYMASRYAPSMSRRKTRLRQLQANLARVQQLLPKLSGSPKYIIMNPASFELQGIQNSQVAITSRVISGKRATPTPNVTAQVRAINILPYWHVPGSIAKRALVPAIRKNPSYLYKERIRVFSTFGGEEVDPSSVNWWGPGSHTLCVSPRSRSAERARCASLRYA